MGYTTLVSLALLRKAGSNLACMSGAKNSLHSLACWWWGEERGEEERREEERGEEEEGGGGEEGGHFVTGLHGLAVEDCVVD